MRKITDLDVLCIFNHEKRYPEPRKIKYNSEDGERISITITQIKMVDQSGSIQSPYMHFLYKCAAEVGEIQVEFSLKFFPTSGKWELEY